MKKVLYTDFENTKNIMDKMLSSKELKKAITRNNLYKFWSKAVGKKFAEKSKPYGMQGAGVMIIACQNSMIAQELLLRKIQILETLKPYLKSLHLKVTDFRFDCKKWSSAESETDEFRPADPIMKKLPAPSEEELESIIINEEELQSIKKILDTNEFATPQLRENMFHAIIKDLKIQHYRENFKPESNTKISE